ncbi:phosphatase PAP2 family protein [Chitinophaga pollutisoli]|uniref:Phosphatase PAP2 family protein n=1 Tax=Chitinophaga pollutisoli TaxID=3133966 RepID=A0ABZ2YQZ8_9BACT
MIFKHLKRKTLFLLPVVFAFLSLVAFKFGATAPHPLEPMSQHYKTLSTLNPQPDASRAWMDTIRYPWSEYGKGAQGNTLWRTVYLSPELERILPGLISPPANSSDQTRAELDYMLQLQQKRTPAEIAQAEHIANIGSWPNILNPEDPDYKENRKQLFYIATSVGEWYNDKNFPATTELLLKCIQDVRVTEFRLKWHFKRPRPYHLEPALKPLARISSPSYASGHSLWAFSEAFLFAEIIPEKRADFVKMAEEVRWSRELMGIHYPSDNEASRVISWSLLSAWYKNPAFVADLKKARKEWANWNKTYQRE